MHLPANIVLIKTSSLGDVLHNLPVVTDILKHHPNAQIDWVVEESFSVIPKLHPGVRSAIPVAIRRWRKGWWAARHELRGVRRVLREGHYDLAIDTQGLLKSALLTYSTRALRCGYDWGSAREPIASWLYDQTFHVPKNLNAVERNRMLAGLVLNYAPQGAPDYGIHVPDVALGWLPQTPYVVLLHATSRDNKLWEETSWIELGKHLHQQGLLAVLPWGSDKEKARSERLSASIPSAMCAPRMNLKEAAALLGKAHAVVGVDTGLSHLAAALDVPTVGLYIATDPGLTGLHAGARAINLGGKHLPPSVGDVVAALSGLGLHV